ncbi:unnamed protein product [Microthlaspi erraticum]|uniref:Uncharacterized protein n=1 Tax=Microthlaspi erraticum TaxID=1685480 RepID=A0A6D2HUT4_9BRAS|nr:unnamed protein product [Microthlaspi erraticum]
MVDSMASSEDHTHGDDNIPKPPPLPRITYQRFQAYRRKPSSSSRLVPKETVETWEKLFKEGIGAEAYVVTDNYSHFPAHSCVLPHPLWLHFWISRGGKMENHISKSLEWCLVK